MGWRGFLAKAKDEWFGVVCAVFCWLFFWGTGTDVVIQFFLRWKEFFAGIVKSKMKFGGKAFAVFVMLTVKAVAVNGLFHEITFF